MCVPVGGERAMLWTRGQGVCSLAFSSVGCGELQLLLNSRLMASAIQRVYETSTGKPWHVEFST